MESKITGKRDHPRSLADGHPVMAGQTGLSSTSASSSSSSNAIQLADHRRVQVMADSPPFGSARAGLPVDLLNLASMTTQQSSSASSSASNPPAWTNPSPSLDSALNLLSLSSSQSHSSPLSAPGLPAAESKASITVGAQARPAPGRLRMALAETLKEVNAPGPYLNGKEFEPRRSQYSQFEFRQQCSELAPAERLSLLNEAMQPLEFPSNHRYHPYEIMHRKFQIEAVTEKMSGDQKLEIFKEYASMADPTAYDEPREALLLACSTGLSAEQRTSLWQALLAAPNPTWTSSIFDLRYTLLSHMAEAMTPDERTQLIRATLDPGTLPTESAALKSELQKREAQLVPLLRKSKLEKEVVIALLSTTLSTPVDKMTDAQCQLHLKHTRALLHTWSCWSTSDVPVELRNELLNPDTLPRSPENRRCELLRRGIGLEALYSCMNVQSAGNELAHLANFEVPAEDPVPARIMQNTAIASFRKALGNTTCAKWADLLSPLGRLEKSSASTSVGTSASSSAELAGDLFYHEALSISSRFESIANLRELPARATRSPAEEDAQAIRAIKIVSIRRALGDDQLKRMADIVTLPADGKGS